MSIFVAIIMGLIQGVAEFLPISSSGHLILAQGLLGLPEDGLMLFNIMLHIATLLAVVIVFHKRIWKLVRNPFCKTNIALLISTAVTVGFVLLFRDWIDRTFTARVLPTTFMVTAVVLVAISLWGSGGKKDGVDKRGALVVGLAQGIAVVPGFSRSGFTISAALATGTKREVAAEYSFLMSIPIIVAALVYEVMGSGGVVMGDVGWVAMGVAFVVALVSGVAAIKFMLHIIRRIPLWWFSVYLVVAAAVALVVL